MTAKASSTERKRWTGRRTAAAAGAAGLVLIAVLAGGPALAASTDAASATSVSAIDARAVSGAAPVSELAPASEAGLAPEAGPISRVAPISEIMPIAEAAVEAISVEPIIETGEPELPPLGLTIFLVSALTLGAGGIAAARLAAHLSEPRPVRAH